MCTQETHRDKHHEGPKIEGMCLVVEVSHSKHGSTVFARPEIAIKSTSFTEVDDIEIISIKLDICTVTSIYKPPNQIFNLKKPENFSSEAINIAVGDFNSRSINWDYADTDESVGESVERWASAANLKLLHDPKLPSSFQSERWRRGYNPDNIFISEKISNMSQNSVLEHIPKSQHMPIMIQITAVVKPLEVPFKRRYNFKKANWSEFKILLDKIQTQK